MRTLKESWFSSVRVTAERYRSSGSIPFCKEGAEKGLMRWKRCCSVPFFPTEITTSLLHAKAASLSAIKPRLAKANDGRQKYMRGIKVRGTFIRTLANAEPEKAAPGEMVHDGKGHLHCPIGHDTKELFPSSKLWGLSQRPYLGFLITS